jgi:Cu/Zn superoxide dismutase
MTQTLMWDLAGLDTACVYGAGDSVSNGCGIHVHSGTSCDLAADVGGHYYSSDLSTDPWADVVYVSDSSGMSSSYTTVNTGLMLWELAGRAFVIHELTSGARIACGVLVAGEMVSVGSFSSYPGYTGSLTSVAGTVNIASSGVVSQVLTWDLTDVDTDCTTGAGDDVANGCGIHVHAGSTCDDADDVGGHYYSSVSNSLEASTTDDPDASDDPWADVVYVADSTGASTGAAQVVTGLTLPDLVGKAFVVHELTSGGRIACGIVDPEEQEDDGEESSARPATLRQLVLPGVLGLSLLLA